MQYTILLLVNATPQWLSLERSTRDQFVANELRPILAKFAETCSIRLFDSDFSNPGVSDFLIIETSDLQAFGHLMGYLRESKTLAFPYFEVKDLIIGVPNNFRGSIDIADIRRPISA